MTYKPVVSVCKMFAAVPAQSEHPMTACCHYGLGIPEPSRGIGYHDFLWGLLGRNGLVYTLEFD